MPTVPRRSFSDRENLACARQPSIQRELPEQRVTLRKERYHIKTRGVVGHLIPSYFALVSLLRIGTIVRTAGLLLHVSGSSRFKAGPVSCITTSTTPHAGSPKQYREYMENYGFGSNDYALQIQSRRLGCTVSHGGVPSAWWCFRGPVFSCPRSMNMKRTSCFRKL